LEPLTLRRREMLRQWNNILGAISEQWKTDDNSSQPLKEVATE